MTTDLALVTPEQAASVANALHDEQALEAFVEQLPATLVAPYLAKIIDAKTNLSALEKGLTRRLVADGQTGQTWEIDGAKFGLYGSEQKGFREIANLFTNLHLFGLSLVELAASVSDARVTDLRAAAARIAKEEDRTAALEAIEAARFVKGERGAPSFRSMDHVVGKKP